MLGLTTRKKLNAAVANNAELREGYEKLSKQVGIILSDITVYRTAQQTTDNPYNSRQTQVQELLKKYRGTAAKGNLLAQRLVNLRVAFSVPNRLLLVKNPLVDATEEEVKKVKEFLEDFMKHNGLDGALPREISKEGELQGAVVISQEWDGSAKLPNLMYYPWNDTAFEVKRAVKYSLKPEYTVTINIDGTKRVLDSEKTSYIAFNETISDPTGYPVCGQILRTIEYLESDMTDWRKLNHLFAHPTPHFKCESQEEAEVINEMITAKGWKVGTAIATNSEFTLKGTTGVEANLLMLSIQTGAKVISGHTGISVHFLGFANVMSNRATAESMGEPTEIILNSEIASWKAFYTDMFNKAIRMRNGELNGTLKEDLIVPKMVPLTDRQWQHIKDIYLPAIDKGRISNATFLDALPDIDPAAEKERIAEEEAKAEEKRKSAPVVPNAQEGDGDEDAENTNNE
jgi:hypothetical protein